MNKDTIIGNWKELVGEAKRQWGKLTDDHWAQVDGDRQKLSGQIQQVYGIAKDEADNQIQKWEDDKSTSKST